jgi:hypothetical protein
MAAKSWLFPWWFLYSELTNLKLSSFRTEFKTVLLQKSSVPAEKFISTISVKNFSARNQSKLPRMSHGYGIVRCWRLIFLFVKGTQSGLKYWAMTGAIIA